LGKRYRNSFDFAKAESPGDKSLEIALADENAGTIKKR